jgi:TonB family protein
MVNETECKTRPCAEWIALLIRPFVVLLEGSALALALAILIPMHAVAGQALTQSQESSQPASTSNPPAAEKPSDWKHYLKPGASIQPPQALESAQPQAPAPVGQDSSKAHYGHSRLRVGISEQGAVDRVEVVKKVGYGLDEKAVEAVKTWKFRPARQDGRPVPVQIYVDINFKLYGPPPK